MKNHGFSLISYQKIMVYKNRYKISRNSWGCGNFDDLGQEFLKNSIMMMIVMVSQFFVPVARPAILMVCKQPLQTTTRHIMIIIEDTTAPPSCGVCPHLDPCPHIYPLTPGGCLGPDFIHFSCTPKLNKIGGPRQLLPYFVKPAVVNKIRFSMPIF